MLLACNDLREINKLNAELNKRFELKDLGLEKILGMKIMRNISRNMLLVTQTSYLQKVLLKFNMFDYKDLQGHMSHHFKLSQSQSPQTSGNGKNLKRTLF